MNLVDPTQLEAAQREQQAMAEVGRLRSRSMGRTFLVSWVALTAMLSFATGVIWAGILGAMAGGFIAKVWVSGKTDEFIDAACKKHGVTREALDPEKYIIE